MIIQLAALFILVTPLKITSVIISLILFAAVYFCVKNIYETPVKKFKSYAAAALFYLRLGMAYLA